MSGQLSGILKSIDKNLKDINHALETNMPLLMADLKRLTDQMEKEKKEGK